MSWIVRILCAMAALLVSAHAVAAQAAEPAKAPGGAAGGNAGGDFVSQIDLKTLGTIAVQNDGRIKSMSSFANEMVGFVAGPRAIAGQDPLFTYFDMLFRPDAYRDADAIYVKGAGPRKNIVETLLRTDNSPEMQARMKAFEEHGLISETLIVKPEVIALLREMRKDLIRNWPKLPLRYVRNNVTMKVARALS